MKLDLKAALLPVLLLSVIISGCSTATINFKYKPLPSPDNLLASVPPVKIKLLHFVDERADNKESTLVGEKQTGVRVGKYPVKSQQTISEVVHSSLSSELIRNGHYVVKDNEDLLMKGTIKTFWLKTDANSEDGSGVDTWDVTAEITVLIEIVTGGNGESIFVGPLSGKYIENRTVEPNIKVLKRIFNRALSKLMKEINSNTELASVLTKK